MCIEAGGHQHNALRHHASLLVNGQTPEGLEVVPCSEGGEGASDGSGSDAGAGDCATDSDDESSEDEPQQQCAPSRAQGACAHFHSTCCGWPVSPVTRMCPREAHVDT